MGQKRRRTGRVLWVQSGWIVHVETLPDRNDHTRIVILYDVKEVEVLS